MAPSHLPKFPKTHQREGWAKLSIIEGSRYAATGWIFRVWGNEGDHSCQLLSFSKRKATENLLCWIPKKSKAIRRNYSKNFDEHNYNWRVAYYNSLIIIIYLLYYLLLIYYNYRECTRVMIIIIIRQFYNYYPFSSNNYDDSYTLYCNNTIVSYNLCITSIIIMWYNYTN